MPPYSQLQSTKLSHIAYINEECDEAVKAAAREEFSLLMEEANNSVSKASEMVAMLMAFSIDEKVTMLSWPL